MVSFGVMRSEGTVRVGRHAVWELHAHLVFVTKYRRTVFTSDILDSCEHIMKNVCDDFGCTLDSFNGEGDYVHVLVTFPATVPLSKLVNSLKGVSSRYLRRQYPDQITQALHKGHLWSRSYYAGTTGAPALTTVENYIRNQKRPTG